MFFQIPGEVHNRYGFSLVGSNLKQGLIPVDPVTYVEIKPKYDQTVRPSRTPKDRPPGKSKSKAAPPALLWEAAKHVGGPIGLNAHPVFLLQFGTRLLERLNDALVGDLLVGRETS